MKETELNSKLLRMVISRDFGIAIVIAASTALISIAVLVYNLGFVQGRSKFEALYLASCPACSHSINRSFIYTLNTLHVYITIGLVIGAIGLWSRKVIGLFLSLSGSILVFGVYVWWYSDTASFLRDELELTSNDPYYKKVGLFLGAVPWDWVVLMVTVVLFIWASGKLTKALRASGVSSLE